MIEPPAPPHTGPIDTSPDRLPGTDSAPESRTGGSLSVRFLLSFLFVLALLRVLFLLATLDPAEERVMEVLDPAGLAWEGGPARPLYDREELYTATAGEAIRRQFGLPATVYQFMPYGGGSLVTALLSIPVQALFGPHYLAFKLIPLLVTLFGAIFWTQLAAWIWGTRSAWIFAGLYLLAPSVFVRTMWIAKGDHSEAATWIGGSLLLAACAARSVAADGSRSSLLRSPAHRYAFACGLAVGFGIFLTYSTVPVLIAVLGSALLLSRMRPPRVWLAGGAGLVIGLAPWIWNLARTGGDALRVYSRPLGASESASEAWSRVRLLFDDGFLASYDLPAGVREAAAAIFALSLLLGAIAMGIHVATSRRRLPPSSVSAAAVPVSAAGAMILLGVIAHLLAYCVSAPDRSSRYLMPVYPLLLLLIAGGASVSLHRLKSLDRALGIATALALLCGIGAQLRAISEGHFRSLAAPLRSTDWALLGEIVGQKLSLDQIPQAPESARPYLWNGLGMRVFHAAERSDWKATIELFPADAREHVWEGLGIAWGQTRSVLEAAAHLDSLPPDSQRAIVRGIARYAELPLVPLARQGVDGAKTAQGMAGRHMDLLEPIRARVYALLEIHGYPPPRVASSGLSPQWKDYGMGSAAYGGIAFPGPSLWFWTDAREDPRNASTATWRGVADSFERDLRTLSPRWLLANGNRPEALASWIEGCARACSPAQSAALYEAAGRAAAAAWEDPDLDEKGRASRSDWPWKEAIPAAMHDAFASGLQRSSN